MPDPILRKELFPFVCQNPACGHQYDAEGFRDVLNLWGLVYADCGDLIYQGITCPKCKKTSLLHFPKNNPLVDLRDFIIAPNPQVFMNIGEQVIERERGDIKNAVLRFRCIPSWDDETVSYADVLKSYPPARYNYSNSHFYVGAPHIPYIMTLNDVQDRLRQENETGEIELRRLYPDIPKFKNLLTCMSPNRITRIEIYDDGVSAKWADGTSAKETQERKDAWIGLLEEVVGRSLKEVVKNRLEPHGVSDFDEETFNNVVSQYAYSFNRKYADQLRQCSRQVGFEADISDYLREKVLPQLLYPICTEIVLKDSRKEVLGWVNKIEPGKALFVDAPMGLGKTYSIIEALTQNPDLSAVISMPTNRLCEEIVTKLKIKIALKKSIHYWKYFENEMDFLDSRLKRTFLQEEVYFADGINEKECPYFNEIVERYRENWIKKADLCEGCEYKARCRFISHWKREPLSRIVVTTHQQYDRFYQQPGIRKWFKYGYDRKDEAVPRDVFIVDEDIVLSRCYQPISLGYKAVKAFSATVTNFLDEIEDTKETANKIHALFGQISECDHTALIRPLDPEFKFPVKIAEQWEKSFSDHAALIPETLDDPGLVGNHLEVIENAIRLGLVVQRYKHPFHRDVKGNQKEIYKAYFPNPKAYDLSKLPPHVFFDGTMLDDKFLNKKLQNIEFERMSIKVKPLWRLGVWQNINTDLPQRWIRRDDTGTKQFVHDLLNELGKSHKYFFVTSKAIRDAYLESFIEQHYPDFDIVLEHYGSFRGTNDANECEIGVMLGSFIPPDAVEIAMALEFIQDKLPENQVTATYPNLWTWKNSKGQRVYKEDYAIVGELAKAFRYCEQRQAIARTRYLFHDVDFYIVSKDPVADYEPFLSKTETDQYRADIFPPRSRRPDSKYEQVKEAVFEWLNEHDSATVMEIHRKTDIRRGTVAQHLNDMADDGLLIRVKTKYMSPLDS